MAEIALDRQGLEAPVVPSGQSDDGRRIDPERQGSEVDLA